MSATLLLPPWRPRPAPPSLPRSCAVDEVGRLAALRAYNILDTEPEDAFDRFARLAADLVGTPTALISLVDAERQWFKAAVGFSLRETPRAIAFCDHAIRQDTPLIVPDATRDPRFARNPLVRAGPRLRFYAGAPLRTPSGHRIGTICAIDSSPRSISDPQIQRLRDLAGAVVTTLELRRMQDEQAQGAHTDPLTGLANRAWLVAQLETGIARHTPADPPFSVVYMGCDELRSVNETLGHDAGDRLLCALADALPGWVRPSDVVSRVGGDEFAAVLPRADEAAARAISERLVHNATRLMARNDWPTTLSVGVVTFHEPTKSAWHMLTLAHGAMMQAKRNGKRQVRVTSVRRATTDAGQLPDSVLQQSLREGIARHELFLEYQPIVPLRADAAPSVEALVRWRHPVFGVLPPSRFIPMSERSGLILPLGQEVVSMAVGQMRAWLDRGDAPARVAINVSGVQLTAPGFVRSVLQALRAARVPADRLELELTEGTLIDESPDVVAALGTLARAGVTVAIDDFGTGYSSLRTLRNLPVHALKIDRTFVADIVSNARDTSIVAAVVAMARTLGLRTVAEGIETEAQRDHLRMLGCDYGQGWLFGRPG